MEIMEMATALGKLIKSDKIMTELAEATAQYEQDAGLLELIDKYNSCSASVRAQEENGDEETLAKLEEALGAIYDDVMEHPTMMRYIVAKDAADKLLADVSSEITFQVTGKRPSAHSCDGSCGGDCGSCGGCE